MRRIISTGVLIAGLALAVPAAATQFAFTLDGPIAAQWTLAKPATPSHLTPTQSFFEDYPGTYGGQTGTAQISFGTDATVPALTLASAAGNATFTGPTLFYDGTERPLFLQGSFRLTDGGGIVSVLTIREIDGTVASGGTPPTPPVIEPGGGGNPVEAIPEPASWALMIAGFVMIGVARRRSARAMARAA